MTGRAHVFDSSSGEFEAVFGDAMQLVSDQMEPAQTHGGEKVTMKLRWRSAGDRISADLVLDRR